MGTKMTPSFANLFRAKFEDDALSNARYQPYTRFRFFGGYFHDLDRRFRLTGISVDYLNNLHPTIKFTCSHSLTNVPFLDVMVSLKDGFIDTDLYTKTAEKTLVFTHLFM